jgi:hypothetical protein
MDFDSSYKLKLKFLHEENIQIHQHVDFHDVEICKRKVRLPGMSWVEIILNLKHDPELFKECFDWYKKQSAYFKTSYSAMKVDIGPFEGLFPSDCDIENLSVTFLVDDYIPGKKSWKDWFIIGEEQYAS